MMIEPDRTVEGCEEEFEMEEIRVEVKEVGD
jgi:hypothetical protein